MIIKKVEEIKEGEKIDWIVGQGMHNVLTCIGEDGVYKVFKDKDSHTGGPKKIYIHKELEVNSDENLPYPIFKDVNSELSYIFDKIEN